MENKWKTNELLEGLIWNYGSLAILSVSGFLFNCLIVHFYNAEALGIFNRTYAWYCVLSQITVWGVHMSVLKLIPENKENVSEREMIFFSALLGVFIFSLVCVVVIEAVLPYIVTGKRNLLTSLQLVMPGLVFFSLNKVILNYLNGLSEMKAYAFFQSLRYIIIVAVIYIWGKLQYDSAWLSICFAESEIVVFGFSVGYLTVNKKLGKKISIRYLKEHIRFGTRILPANMVVELNTKVDIICLGFILNNDYLIGIYSFAVIFAEGFYQLYIIVRRSINPKITECYVGNDFHRGIGKINAYLKKYLKIFSPIALVLLIIGYCSICYILNQEDYMTGVKFLILICLAIAVNGRKIIFGNIFSQTGFPIYESVVNMITVTANFCLNFLLIHFWGLWGAAIATAVSHMIYGSVLQYYARKGLDFKI